MQPAAAQRKRHRAARQISPGRALACNAPASYAAPAALEAPQRHTQAHSRETERHWVTRHGAQPGGRQNCVLTTRRLSVRALIRAGPRACARAAAHFSCERRGHEGAEGACCGCAKGLALLLLLILVQLCCCTRGTCVGAPGPAAAPADSAESKCKVAGAREARTRARARARAPDCGARERNEDCGGLARRCFRAAALCQLMAWMEPAVLRSKGPGWRQSLIRRGEFGGPALGRRRRRGRALGTTPRPTCEDSNSKRGGLCRCRGQQGGLCHVGGAAYRQPAAGGVR